MKYSKCRCTILALFAGLAAGVVHAAAADSKGAAPAGGPKTVADPSAAEIASESRPPVRQVDGPKESPAKPDESTAGVSAANPPPAAPANVRITVQTSDSGTSGPASGSSGGGDPASVPTGPSRTPVATALDAQNFAPTLRAATAESRGTMIANVELRLNAAEAALDAKAKSDAEMSSAGRQQFKAAMMDARGKAKALRKSMELARRSTNEEWEGARAQIAADYHAYAAALARIDSAMGVGAAR